MIRPVLAYTVALAILSLSPLHGQEKDPAKEKPLTLQKIYDCKTTSFDGNNPYKAVIDIFERGENVQPLGKIEDMGKVRPLLDFNRFQGNIVSSDKSPSEAEIAASKAIAAPGVSTEENSKRESAAAEEKEGDNKDEKNEAEEKEPAEKTPALSVVAVPEDASFVITGNTSGILFALKSKPGKQAVIELILTPEQAGRFGKAGLHILMDQDSGNVTNLAWQYDGGYKFSRGVRSYNWTLKSGEKIFALYMSWPVFLNTIGELPMDGGRPVTWRFNVFRWAGDAGASFVGTPHDYSQTPFIILPRLSAKEIASIQAGLLNNAISSFYEKKQGQETYFAEIKRHLEGAKSYNENFGLRMRLAYTLSYSERYLAEDTEMMEEFSKRALKAAQDSKEFKGDESIAEAFGQYYELIANWNREMEILRLRALSNKVFSSSFGDE